MAKPAVDGLERELSNEMGFARVNINEGAGRKLAQKYRIRAVPTFLMVAPGGKVLYRQTGGKPDRAAIMKHLQAEL